MLAKVEALANTTSVAEPLLKTIAENNLCKNFQYIRYIRSGVSNLLCPGSVRKVEAGPAILGFILSKKGIGLVIRGPEFFFLFLAQ